MKIINKDRGYFPMYWSVFEDYNLGYQEIFFLHYLIETFPILTECKEIDGIEYKRLSYNMINNRLRARDKNGVHALTDDTIRKWTQLLMDNGYIKTWQPYSRGPIYYAITSSIESSSQNSGQSSGQSSGRNSSTIDIKDIKDTKDIIITKQETKHEYGEYKHVRLTDKEYEKLVNDYGEAKIIEFIRKLDEGIELKGYKYKNHNLAIRKWLGNDKTPVDPMRCVSERANEADRIRNADGSLKVY